MTYIYIINNHIFNYWLSITHPLINSDTMDSQWIVPFISPSWWFGTFGLFFHSVGNFMIPTEKLIFFRAVA